MYIGQKRKVKESVPPLINEKRSGDERTDMEKDEVANNFFASVFTASQVSHVSCFPEPVDDGWGIKVSPL